MDSSEASEVWKQKWMLALCGHLEREMKHRGVGGDGVLPTQIWSQTCHVTFPDSEYWFLLLFIKPLTIILSQVCLFFISAVPGVPRKWNLTQQDSVQ